MILRNLFPAVLSDVNLGVINTLKEQNKKLKEQMREQQERLRQYAHEYLLMGNECITQAHDSRAALANYDKALSLDPNYVDAWIRKGITLFNNKEYFDAETASTLQSPSIRQTLKLSITAESSG